MSVQRVRRYCAPPERMDIRWLEEAPPQRLPTDLDAIVILGGGQDAARPSGLPEGVERRLQLAADLLARQPPHCTVLCSGGGALPSGGGAGAFDGTACAKSLGHVCGYTTHAAESLLLSSSESVLLPCSNSPSWPSRSRCRPCSRRQASVPLMASLR